MVLVVVGVHVCVCGRVYASWCARAFFPSVPMISLFPLRCDVDPPPFFIYFFFLYFLFTFCIYIVIWFTVQYFGCHDSFIHFKNIARTSRYGQNVGEPGRRGDCHQRRSYDSLAGMKMTRIHSRFSFPCKGDTKKM